MGWRQDSGNISTIDDLLDAYIALYKGRIVTCPGDMPTGVHHCRGNFIGGRYFAEDAYDVIAGKLFQDLKILT